MALDSADWDNIQTQCISYAGYDAKTYPVNKNKLGKSGDGR